MDAMAKNPVAPLRHDVKLFSFFEELADPLQKVALKAWEARGKLFNDIISYSALLGKTTLSIPVRSMKVLNDNKLWIFIAEQDDPEALAFVFAGTGSALCLGSAGAVVGGTVGGAAGTAVGTIPAIFTFGLSIPVGAVLGGGGGVAFGSLAGGCAGFVAGGASGYTVAYFRGDIRRCLLRVGACCHDTYFTLVVNPVNKVKWTSRALGDKVYTVKEGTKRKSKVAAQGVANFVSDSRVQATALGAGTGAAALGTAGAATGTTLGAAGGALIGLVPAIFTFGLSIPIGAVVGGGAGLCVGAAAGTATGFVGGGAVGCASHAYYKHPGGALSFTKAQARGALNFASSLVGAGSTGGTPAFPSDSPESTNFEPEPKITILREASVSG
jgi:hypothetical protein